MAKGSFGKTQTTYGQWANRHFSWDNPLVNAPLTYEWLTTALGSGPNAGKLGSKKLAANRNTWVPVIWGPSYTTGGQFTGTIDVFDYGFEIKNTALSSAPDEWDLWNHGFYGDALTYSGRVGWRPRTDWNLGISGSNTGGKGSKTRGPLLGPNPALFMVKGNLFLFRIARVEVVFLVYFCLAGAVLQQRCEGFHRKGCSGCALVWRFFIVAH